MIVMERLASGAKHHRSAGTQRSAANPRQGLKKPLNAQTSERSANASHERTHGSNATAGSQSESF